MRFPFSPLKHLKAWDDRPACSATVNWPWGFCEVKWEGNLPILNSLYTTSYHCLRAHLHLKEALGQLPRPISVSYYFLLKIISFFHLPFHYNFCSYWKRGKTSSRSYLSLCTCTHTYTTHIQDKDASWTTETSVLVVLQWVNAFLLTIHLSILPIDLCLPRPGASPSSAAESLVSIQKQMAQHAFQDQEQKARRTSSYQIR